MDAILHNNDSKLYVLNNKIHELARDIDTRAQQSVGRTA